MTAFDTILIVDWSAAQGAQRAARNAIWIGLARNGAAAEAHHFPTRVAAERWLAEEFAAETAAGRRVLAGFDFPFGYPRGFAKGVTGSDDPLVLWDWLEARIDDDATGRNNRYAVAAEMNRMFPGQGPFWGKPNEVDHPDIPYRGSERHGVDLPEKRACDAEAGAASTCWQLAFPPTVGSQVLMGLPMLARLRRKGGVAVWPFEHWGDAPVVLAEIWPGLIEKAVKAAGEGIRDAQQVRLLAEAFARLPADELAAMMEVEAPEEGWILGAGYRARLTELAMPSAVPLAPPPPLKNDCFALPPGVEWTPVDEALAMLRNRLRPVMGVEEGPVAEADGRILAEAVTARRSNPPGANSAVDGYGFAHASTDEGPQTLPLLSGRAAAGAPYGGAVPPGTAIRILTGALLPEGIDTVVLEEDTRSDGTRVAFNGPVRKGANTRRAGEDVEAGDDVFVPGHVLRPPDLALLTAVGTAGVAVRARLRVGVLSTGDELAEPGTTFDPGRTYDANRPMLLALARRWGHAAVDLGHVGDDRAALRDRLDTAEADVILTSGGASAGDEDHVSALLGEAGALSAWRIALKPGRPLALGVWQGRPVFGLPGNPVAAFTCALIFARPALSVLAGGGWLAPQAMSFPAAFSKRKKPGRREYLRARIGPEGVEIFASEGSGRISGIAWAEGLVELGDEAMEIRPGDPVRFLSYAGFGLG